MGSGLVINNLSTGGQVYKLKDGVSIDQAYQKGLKDGLDQVYFTAGKDNYVLEGDNLKLGELKQALKGNIPDMVVKLDNKPTEIHIDKIDESVSTVKEGFVKNGKIASYSTTAIGVGIPVAAFSGISALVTMGSTSSAAKALSVGGIYVGLAAAAAGIVGLVYYGGKSVYDGSSNKPNPAQSESFKGAKVDTENNAKPAGLVSVKEKMDVATNIITDIIFDGTMDAITNNK
jgi:hypothetical protein